MDKEREAEVREIVANLSEDELDEPDRIIRELLAELDAARAATVAERNRCAGLVSEAAELLFKSNRKKAAAEFDIVLLAIQRGDAVRGS